MMKEIKMGVFTYKNESYDFNFKTSLSAYDKLLFVKTVVNNLIDDSGYDAIIKDLIFDFTIIELFTNIDTSFIEIKDDEGNSLHPIIPIEHFLEESNVVEIVKENMEVGLLEELRRAVDLDIQYRTGINSNSLNEALVGLVSTLEEKIGEVDLDSMMSMAQKFAGMTEDFTLENIVNTYMDSDVHKKNLLEIEEAKQK